MRKFSCCLLAVVLCLTLCGGRNALGEGTIEVPVIEDLKTFDIPENDALAFIRSMKAGWNLGNTFDAFDDEGWFKKGEPEMETAWVGVKTSRKLIQTVHAAGFETIRIPVSWHNHVDDNFQVNALWMERVKEVVSWALDEGMYVIVNVHHDNQEAFFYPDRVHEEHSRAYLTAIWTQMAEAFRDCDEHLILESMNEPRLVGTPYEWNWTAGSPECREAAECINELNQLFVDTVRASGGSDATRYLLVPAYDASPYYAAASAFQLPSDTVENRIIVEAHAYTPYNFALNLQSDDRSFTLKDASKKSDIAQFLDGLYQRFVSRGVPVIMDEFGALDKKGNLQDRVNFAAWYVASASVRGITCCWWDNHAFSGSGEIFGLINRSTCEWKYPEIVDAIQKNCLLHR